MAMVIPGFSETPPPEGLRDFDDADAVREAVYGRSLEALRRKFPYSEGGLRLELKDLKYAGPRHFSLADQKRAMMTGRTLRTPVSASLKLVDETTGSVLDEKDEVVMSVPYWTARNTFISRGNDISISNQNRLKPGVYVRTKRTGEHEAQFNIKPGTGSGFRLRLEPETGLFKVDVAQASVPAYQFLKAAGVPDKDMEDAWGPELLARNMEKQDARAVEKLVSRFAPFRKSEAGEDREAALRDVLARMELDPWVVERTLGVAGAGAVTPDVLLRATRKLLNVNRGDEEDDDRDAPEFSSVHSVDDFLEERVDKDAGKLFKGLLHRIRRTRSLKPVSRGVLDGYFSSFLYGSGLAMDPEETNPVSMMDQASRQIKFGEGGIGDAHMLTEEAREVNPGQVGFIDPVATSESEKIGADLRYAYRTFKGPDRQMYGEFMDAKTGKPAYLKPEDVSSATLGFPGQDGMDTVYALRKSRMVQVPRDEVDYFVPTMAHMYSHGANLTPLPTGFMPNRLLFSAKYWTQFLPVVGGETPMVKSEVPGTGRPFTEYYGRRTACLNSPVAGTVSKVNEHGVTVVDDDGGSHFIETVRDFPLNRLTALTYTPAVRPGDRVDRGGLIASSNFTDSKGELNMGVNLKTAVLPYRGWSFEDAYTISESAAKKLSTEQLYGFDVDARNGTKISRSSYLSAFPKTFTNAQVDKLDKAGVVKTGMTVEKGDPLVLAVGPRTLSAEDAQLGRLHKLFRNALVDRSQVWEYDLPGTVTDVALTAKGAKVNVKVRAPVRIGDKLSTANASKGVVGRIIPDDEMPRDPASGEAYDMLFNPMTILSRVAPNQIVEMQLAKIAKKTGRPYVLPQDPPEEGWAAFAAAELEKHGLREAADVYDPVSGRTIKNVGEGYMYIAPFHHLAEKKLCIHEDGTEVLTDAGWIKASELKPHHRVMTYCAADGRREFKYPTGINRYNVDGQPMYLIEDSEQEQEVTSGHRVVVDQTSVSTELAERLWQLQEKGLL